MKTPGGTVRTISSRALVDACANLGVDTDQLLQSVGVERQVLQDPDARIPTEMLTARDAAVRRVLAGRLLPPRERGRGRLRSPARRVLASRARRHVRTPAHLPGPGAVRSRADPTRLAREVWDQPNAHPNPDLCAMLEEHARRLLAELPSEGLVGEIRRLTTAELKGGRPTLEHVSGLASMSGRTLQRRLKQEGTSFGELLDWLRRGMAQACLEDEQISISEVSYLLGFSEQSAFHRAFKRWTGSTPVQFRKTTARSAT